MRIRLLTAADLHQSRLHYRSLELATKELKPDVVAVVGDALHFGDIGKYQFATAECARMLADLPVRHLIFVRGNHEGSNWTGFVRAWPFETRPLTVLYGTSCAIGPLVIVGFPCMSGPAEYWREHFRKDHPWKSRFTRARAVKERVPVPMRQDSPEPPAARTNGKETRFSQRETACPTPNRCGKQRTCFLPEGI